jgi:hypothetical protein
MARHHRHAVQTPATSTATVAGPAPQEAEAAPAPASLKWRVALLVWALGLAGLALFELLRFAVKAIRAAAA